MQKYNGVVEVRGLPFNFQGGGGPGFFQKKKKKTLKISAGLKKKKKKKSNLKFSEKENLEKN